MNNIDKSIKSMLGKKSFNMFNSSNIPNKIVNKKLNPLSKAMSMKNSFDNIVPNKILNKKLNVPKLITGFTNHKRLDKDGDGIPNWKDCQPKNIFRQDAMPNRLMMERISKLDIYYYTADGRVIPVTQLENNRQTQTMKNLYHEFKRSPGLIGELENRKGRVAIYITGDKPVYKYLFDNERFIGKALPYSDDEKTKVSDHVIALKSNPDAETIYHELKHTDQGHNKPIKQYSEERNKEEKDFEEGKIKYIEKPTEYEAETYAAENMFKYSKKNLTDEERSILSKLYMDFRVGKLSEEEYINKRNDIYEKAEERKKSGIQSFMERQ